MPAFQLSSTPFASRPGRLPRLLARGRDALQDVASLGQGGLLAPGQEYRFPPYGELPV